MKHLRVLVAKTGKSVRQIERDAHLRESALGYYLKPGVVPSLIPPVGTIQRLARALECTKADLFEAFAKDLGYL